MDILRLADSQSFLVVANEEADTLGPDWIEDFKQFLEARVGKIVESWEKAGSHTFKIEAFVGERDILRVISHAYPECVFSFCYLFGDTAERVNIARGGPKMDVANGVEVEGVGA